MILYRLLNEARSFNHMLDTIEAGYENQRKKKILPHEIDTYNNYNGRLDYAEYNPQNFSNFLNSSSIQKINTNQNIFNHLLNKANQVLPNYTDFDKYEKMWHNYNFAMSRRRPESVLPKYNFMNYIISNGGNNSIISTKGTDFIVHQTPLKVNNQRIIVPSHFAPNGLKQGVRAIGDLKDRGGVIFAVTPDLQPMLKKAGYIDINLPFESPFRGRIVQKKLAVSDKDTMNVLFNKLQDEYQQARRGRWRAGATRPEIQTPFGKLDLPRLKNALSNFHEKYFNNSYESLLSPFNKLVHNIASGKAKNLLAKKFPTKTDEYGWRERLTTRRLAGSTKPDQN